MLAMPGKQQRLPKRIKPLKIPSPVYRQFWRIVDGAVRDALRSHPSYLAPGARERTVRNSLNKRIVGALAGYVAETRRRADPG